MASTLRKFSSYDTVEIKGRGTAHLIEKTQDPPYKGEVIILDGYKAKVCRIEYMINALDGAINSNIGVFVKKYI